MTSSGCSPTRLHRSTSSSTSAAPRVAAVAAGFLGLPLVENTHTANVHVTVALGERRRGVGRQMAEYLLDRARRGRSARRDRDRWLPARRHLAGQRDGGEAGGDRGARLHPARAAARCELDRAELDARLKVLRDGHGAPYDLVSWVDTCPDHLVEGAAALLPRVMSDSPQGELDMEDEVWDAARFREYEAMFVARRRHQLATAAVERATGRFVAFTDLNVPFSDHRVVSQFGTVVEPDHRGHRLGLAVKTANLLNVLDAYPDAETHPDLQRRGERAHDRGQRGARLPRRRALHPLAAGALSHRRPPAPL